MKRKNMFLLFSSLFVFLVLIGDGMALDEMEADRINITYPINGSTVTGMDDDTNFTMNISYISANEVMNCTFYAYSPSTGNNTWTTLGTDLNDSANQTDFFINWNYTNDGKLLEDSNDYYWTANCTNSSNDFYYLLTPNSNIIVDWVVPNTPISLSPVDGYTEKDKSVDFSVTVADENATSSRLNFGVRQYTMDCSASSCTYTLDNIPEQTYEWYVTASDGTNSTNSAANTIRIDAPTSSGKAKALMKYYGAEPKGGHTFTISSTGDKITSFFTNNLWLVAIVIIAVGIFVWKKYK